jgi:murein DD-endopeptidase / murein LD-carboxypeptidase
MPVDPRTARARALVGTLFRLHGRDPETGLDCVGLIARAIEREALAPMGYSMRGGSEAGWVAMLNGVMTRRRTGQEPGDIVFFKAGPAQFHLGLWTGNSLIHADASLRRVVETPGPPRWPVIGAWGKVKRNV